MTVDTVDLAPDMREAPGLAPAEIQAAAETDYARSLASGTPLSAAALAARYGRKTRWGYQRIAAVKAQHNPTPAPAAPTALPRLHTVPDTAAPAAKAVHKPVQSVQKPKPKPVPTAQPAPTGKGWAYAGFVAGLTVSIAANMLHALTPSAGIAQLAGAAVWPIFLLIAVEVLSRIDWGNRTTARLAGVTGAFAVAAVAAIASYQHMRGLLLAWGEAPWLAAIEPLAVDGLMVLCGMAILTFGRPTRQ